MFIYKEFCLLLSFISRVPVNVSWDSTEADWGRSFRLLPLWGLIIGLLVASVGALLAAVSPLVGAIAGVGVGILLTGGLHLDGLMDVADGFGSSREREKMLEIMKDSRVGSMGVTAAIFVLLARFALYYQLLLDWRVFWVLPAAMVFSRWLMSFAVFNFPAARPTGLGATLHNHFQKPHFWCSCGIAAVLLILFQEGQALIAAVLALVVCYYLCRKWSRKLGGLTGDCYGALAEWSEVIFLLAFYVVRAALFLLTAMTGNWYF